jgi:osmotically-inducible protein OsmY
LRSYGHGTSYGGGLGGSQEMGRFAGRGPKNWHRSDERIREDVNERLTDHPDIDASEIEVQVKNGEVTLAGTLNDRHSKRLAEEVAERVSGVKEVHNQVRIQTTAQTGSSLNR